MGELHLNIQTRVSRGFRSVARSGVVGGSTNSWKSCHRHYKQNDRRYLPLQTFGHDVLSTLLSSD
jgi:hypothetical protein